MMPLSASGRAPAMIRPGAFRRHSENAAGVRKFCAPAHRDHREMMVRFDADVSSLNSGRLRDAGPPLFSHREAR